MFQVVEVEFTWTVLYHHSALAGLPGLLMYAQSYGMSPKNKAGHRD